MIKNVPLPVREDSNIVHNLRHPSRWDRKVVYDVHHPSHRVMKIHEYLRYPIEKAMNFHEHVRDPSSRDAFIAHDVAIPFTWDRINVPILFDPTRWVDKFVRFVAWNLLKLLSLSRVLRDLQRGAWTCAGHGGSGGAFPAGPCGSADPTRLSNGAPPPPPALRHACSSLALFFRPPPHSRLSRRRVAWWSMSTPRPSGRSSSSSC